MDLLALVSALVALVVLQLIIAGACAWAYIGIKQEMRAIENLKPGISRAQLTADEAKSLALSVDTEQYQSLRKRVDTLSEGVGEVQKSNARVADQLVSMRGQLGALKRHYGKADENPSPDGGTELPLQFQAPATVPAEPAPRTHHFGRKVA